MYILSRETGIYNSHQHPVRWEDIKDGTKLRVHSKEWFDENCMKSSQGFYIVNVTSRFTYCTYTSLGIVAFKECFTEEMSQFFGKTVTVKMDSVYKQDGQSRILVLRVDEDDDIGQCWFPEMFERVVD